MMVNTQYARVHGELIPKKMQLARYPTQADSFLGSLGPWVLGSLGPWVLGSLGPCSPPPQTGWAVTADAALLAPVGPVGYIR